MVELVFSEVDFYCPVKEGLLKLGDCWTIKDIADGAPLHEYLPKDVVWKEEKIKLCKNCHNRYGAGHAILWGGKEVFVQRYVDGGIYATEATEPKDWKWFRITRYHIKKWLEDEPMSLWLRLGIRHWI